MNAESSLAVQVGTPPEGVPMSGITTREGVIKALEQQAKMPVVRTGDMLVRMGMISVEDLQDALALQRADPSKPIGDILVRQGKVSQRDFDIAMARKLGYPEVDVLGFTPDAAAMQRLPLAVARRLGVLPLVLNGKQMVVAMTDPKRREDVEALSFATGCRILPVLANAEQLPKAITQAYSALKTAVLPQVTPASLPEDATYEIPEVATKLLETLEQEHSKAGDAPEEDDSVIETSDNSLVKLINSMIIDAWAQRASDVHIETQPGRERVRIRFRRDGVLKPYMDLPHTFRAAIVARLKIMCDLDISERRKPQDGKINFARFSAQHPIELRVVTIPTNNGLEDVVLRLLTSAEPMPLDRLSFSEPNLERIKTAINRPYGMVLCVGPTGSGKTTTLHACLRQINTPDRKIWTAEDPVEITQPGLRQVQVNARIDWTFDKALRSFLRADPDVIMIGEIRDQETAHTAVEAALTGHMVMSTLHTNSAVETITRLLDMGLDSFNFGDSLLAVVGQRLVRRLCPHCRTQRDASPDEIEELLDDYCHAFPDDGVVERDALRREWEGAYGLNGRIQHFEAPGCKRCDGTGLIGRMGLHEVVSVSRALRRLIHNKATVEDMLRCAMAEGMRTLRQDGIVKALMGQTSIAEVRATSNA